MTTRIERTAAFVARLYHVSLSSRNSWRRAASIGADIGIDGEILERAISDAERAGLIDRRQDDRGLVLLTDRGRAAAGA